MHALRLALWLLFVIITHVLDHPLKGPNFSGESKCPLSKFCHRLCVNHKLVLIITNKTYLPKKHLNDFPSLFVLDKS